MVLVGLGLVWSGCLVEFGFGCVWCGLGPSPSKGFHYCVPWCGVLIHVACCVACRGRAVVVGVGVGVGWVWFGVVWLLGWVWFGFGCGLRQGFKEQNTMKSNTFAYPHGSAKAHARARARGHILRIGRASHRSFSK